MDGFNERRRKSTAVVKFANAYVTDIEPPLVGTSTGVSFGRHHLLCDKYDSGSNTGCIIYVTMKAGPKPVALVVDNLVLDEASGISGRQQVQNRSVNTINGVMQQLAAAMHQALSRSPLFSLRSYVYSEDDGTFVKVPLKIGVSETAQQRSVDRIADVVNEALDIVHTAGGFLSFISATDSSLLPDGRISKVIAKQSGSDAVLPYVEVMAFKYIEENSTVAIYPPLGFETPITGFPVEGKDGWIYATAMLPDQDKQESSEFRNYLIKMKRRDTSDIGGLSEFEVRVIEEIPAGFILAGPDVDEGSVEKRAVYYDILSNSYVVCNAKSGEHMTADCTVVADEMEPYPAFVWKGLITALEGFGYRVFTARANLVYPVEEPEEIRSALRFFPALKEKYDYTKGKTLMGNPIEVYPPKWSNSFRLRMRMRLKEDKAVIMWKSMVVEFSSIIEKKP